MPARAPTPRLSGRFARLAGACLLLAGLSGQAFAQLVIPWLGGSGTWNDPLRWLGGTVPLNTPLLHFGAQIGAGDALVSSDVTIDYLQLTGGSIGGPGTLTLEGPVTSTWQGGSLSGTGTLRIASTGTLELVGSGTKTYHRNDGLASTGGRTIENFGTITVLGTGSLLGGEGGQIVNRAGALFDLKQDTLFGHTGTGSTPTFTNAGTLRKSGGDSAAVFSSVAFVNSGTVEVTSGSIGFGAAVTSNGGTFDAADGTTISFAGGQTFNNGTAFAGDGLILIAGNTTTFSGALTSQNLRFAGGTLLGTATMSGSMQWTGGDWAGTGTFTLAEDSYLEIFGPGAKTFTRADGLASSGGRTIENYGTITWSDSDLLGGEGAQIVNRSGGEFTVLASATLGYTGTGSLPMFVNEGLFRKAEIGGTTTVSNLNFLNTGEVAVDTGTLSFTGSVTGTGGLFVTGPDGNILFSGAQTFTDTIFSADGAIRIVGGNTTVSGNLTGGDLEFAGGTLSGSALLLGGMSWTGGTWQSPHTLSVASSAVLTLSGAADKTLRRGDGLSSSSGRVVLVGGSLYWQDAGRIVGQEGAGISVASGGLFKIFNASSYLWGGTGDYPSLINAGTVRKLANSGTTTFDSVLFSNTGRLEIQSGTLSLIGAGGLANNGTVEIQSGTLVSSASGATSTGGTFDVYSGSLLNYTGGTNTFVNATFTGGGETRIDGGTLVVSGSTISGTVRLLSGIIAGSGTFTVASGGGFDWLGGTLSGTGTLAIAAGGELSIEGSATKTFWRNDGLASSGGRLITNLGLTTWSGSGSLLGGEGARFENLAGGTFEIEGDATFGYNGTGTVPTFLNAGLLRKSLGGGTTDFSQSFTTSGTVRGQSGLLRFSGGGSSTGAFYASGGEIAFSAGYTWGDGTRFLGSGTTRVTGGTMEIPGGATVRVGSATEYGILSLEGGSLTGAGLLLIEPLGRVDWSAGTLRGTGTLQIATGAQLIVLGPGNHDFLRDDGLSSHGGRTLENFGTLLWLGGNLRGGEGAQILNRAGGVFEIQTAGSLGYNGVGATPSFTNAGTFRKTDGGTTTVSNMAFATTGAVDVLHGDLVFATGVTSTGATFSALSGTSLTFSGGQSFTDATFTGAGTMQLTGGTTTLGGTLAASRLLFAGGSLLGTATLAGTLEWTGGTMNGPHTLTVASSATLQLTGTGDRAFARADGLSSSGGRTIENFGTLLVENTGHVLGGEGGQIVNRADGLVEIRNSGTFGYTGTGTLPSFTNEGTLRKLASSGTTYFSSMSFTNTGQVLVQAGTLQFDSTVNNHGGSFSASSGTTLVFAGGQTFQGGTTLGGVGLTRLTGGTTTWVGDVSAQNLEFAGGSLVGTGTLASGTLRWTGGDIRGPDTLTIASGALFLVTGTGDRTWHRADGLSSSGGRIIENRGVLRVENTGHLLGGEGAQIVNRSTGYLDLRNNATLGYSGTGSLPSLTNEGVLGKSAGTGTSTIAVPFTNTGTISVTSGTLAFTSTFNNSGNVSLVGGATLSVSSSFTNGTGTLAGTGTLVSPHATLGGVVSPGLPNGTLAVTGNLTLLATSTLLIELGGTAQGSTYDFLNVSGTGTVGGTLVLTLSGGFTPTTPGATFTVFTASGGLTGAFANIANGQRLLTSDGLNSFQVNYGLGSAFAANSVVLSNFTAVPEPSTWVLMIVGAAATVVSWRRRGRR